MKNLVLGTLASLALAFNAHAADMAVKAPMAPYVPPPTWTGFYLGFNGGWGWSNNTHATVTPFGTFTTADLVPFTLSGSNADGAVWGGQIGYNWQVGSWVLGIEGDFDGTGITGTRHSVFASLADPAFTNGFTATGKVNWLASIRGRLGYIWGPGMWYFTGGGAWEDVTVDALFSDGFFGASVAGSFSKTFSGFVVGGGYEWMINPNWTVRGEYLFYDFSNSNSTARSLALPGCVPSCGVLVSETNREVNVFRLGVNYKF